MSLACCVCGGTEDLRSAPLMTGELVAPQPAPRPVCRECYLAWYERAGTTVVEILRARVRRMREASRGVRGAAVVEEPRP